ALMKAVLPEMRFRKLDLVFIGSLVENAAVLFVDHALEPARIRRRQIARQTLCRGGAMTPAPKEIRHRRLIELGKRPPFGARPDAEVRRGRFLSGELLAPSSHVRWSRELERTGVAEHAALGDVGVLERRIHVAHAELLPVAAPEQTAGEM